MDNPIKIKYYSQNIDNYGRQESSMKGEVIFNVLHNPDEWTDDMVFEGENQQIYFIDDLIGKRIQLDNIGVFLLEDN
jgi:hypothetical protein